MKLQLPPDLLPLLEEIVRSRRPDMLGLLDPLTKNLISEQQRDDLCQVATDEFCASGIREDGEPNQRGLCIENLINHLLRLSVARTC